MQAPFRLQPEMQRLPVQPVLVGGKAHGVDHDLTRCKAFVVLKSGIAPIPNLHDELRSYLKARLAPHKVPREIVMLDELPKTPTGRIQRFKLREREAAKA